MAGHAGGYLAAARHVAGRKLLTFPLMTNDKAHMLSVPGGTGPQLIWQGRPLKATNMLNVGCFLVYP
jgi:hypothetical protein